MNTELNTWLAQNVIGWSYDDATGEVRRGGEVVHLMPAGTGLTLAYLFQRRAPECPDYSGTYDGMGAVIERMREKGWAFELSGEGPSEWRAVFDKAVAGKYEHASTAPLAVALAAKAAIESETK